MMQPPNDVPYDSDNERDKEEANSEYRNPWSPFAAASPDTIKTQGNVGTPCSVTTESDSTIEENTKNTHRPNDAMPNPYYTDRMDDLESRQLTDEEKRQLEDDLKNKREYTGIPESDTDDVVGFNTLQDQFITIIEKTKKVVALAALFISAGASLFLIFQFMPFLVSLSMLSPWIQFPVAILVITLTGILLFYFGKLFYSGVRLQTSPNTRFRELSKRDKRCDIKTWENDPDQAKLLRSLVEDYLRHAFAGDVREKELIATNLPKDKIKWVLGQAKDLLSDNRMSAKDWIRQFRTNIQTSLDTHANTIVWRHVKRVGVRTLVAPYAWLDAIFMLYQIISLERELLQLYGVRPDLVNVTLLSVKSAGSVYIASQWDHIYESAIDCLDPEMFTVLEETAAGILGQTLVAGLGKAAPGFLKTLSGSAANAFMVYRIGISSIYHLQPTQRKRK